MNKIGKYTIEKNLDRGNFGDIYLVHAKFAVKKIPTDLKEEQKRIEKEVIALKRLNHVNVVKFEESFLENDVVFVVFEYCNGGDLNSYVIKHPDIDTFTLMRITRQIAKGLEYIHEINVIHRDIKPDNIMIVDEGFWITVKLADFGLARVWDTFSYQSPFYPKGPKYYSAPEVRRGLVTKKSDIFSMGCVIMAIYSRQTVTWINGKKLLAPYIGSAAHQICHATDQQKDQYIKRYICALNKQHQMQLQEMVYEMVQGDWRRRPNAQQILQRVPTYFLEACTIL